MHYTLSETVPRLFQLWACKQVMNIAATNEFLSRQDGRCSRCPSCAVEVESAEHVIRCKEVGRVEVYNLGVDALEAWLEGAGTDPELCEVIVEYARMRGKRTMGQICEDAPACFWRMATSQDKIGWHRFMEGMVSKEMIRLQLEYAAVGGSRYGIQRWAAGLITKLLEITHGQWIYRNLLVHDRVAGTMVNQRREELVVEIRQQQELGDEGLLEEDKFLAEVNIGELGDAGGARQEYWLLAIKTARKAFVLRGTQHGQSSVVGR